jgi:hypothetical protein
LYIYLFEYSTFEIKKGVRKAKIDRGYKSNRNRI